MLEAIKNRWRSPQDPGSGVYPRTLSGTTASKECQFPMVEDGSYLTVKNITFGYTLAGEPVAIRLPKDQGLSFGATGV